MQAESCSYRGTQASVPEVCWDAGTASRLLEASSSGMPATWIATGARVKYINHTTPPHMLIRRQVLQVSKWHGTASGPTAHVMPHKLTSALYFAARCNSNVANATHVVVSQWVRQQNSELLPDNDTVNW